MDHMSEKTFNLSWEELALVLEKESAEVVHKQDLENGDIQACLELDQWHLDKSPVINLLL
jgi:hypothetical protein